MLTQFYNHLEKEKNSRDQIIRKLQTALTMKISILENKVLVLDDFNMILKQVNLFLFGS